MSASWLGLLTALTNPFCVYSLSCLWSLLTQAPGKSMSSRFSWCHLRAAVTGRGRQCHGDCCPDAPSRHPGPPDLVLSSDLQSPSTATPPPFPECPLPRGLTTIAHKHCQQGPQPCSSSRRRPPSCVSLVCRGCGCRSVVGSAQARLLPSEQGQKELLLELEERRAGTAWPCDREALPAHACHPRPPYRLRGELAWCTQLKRNKTLSQIKWNLRSKHNCIL